MCSVFVKRATFFRERALYFCKRVVIWDVERASEMSRGKRVQCGEFVKRAPFPHERALYFCKRVVVWDVERASEMSRGK